MEWIQINWQSWRNLLMIMSNVESIFCEPTGESTITSPCTDGLCILPLFGTKSIKCTKHERNMKDFLSQKYCFKNRAWKQNIFLLERWFTFLYCKIMNHESFIHHFLENIQNLPRKNMSAHYKFSCRFWSDLSQMRALLLMIKRRNQHFDGVQSFCE